MLGVEVDGVVEDGDIFVRGRDGESVVLSHDVKRNEACFLVSWGCVLGLCVVCEVVDSDRQIMGMRWMKMAM